MFLDCVMPRFRSIIAVLCAFILYDRLMAGKWDVAIWPALLLGWCVYRLLDFADEE